MPRLPKAFPDMRRISTGPAGLSEVQRRVPVRTKFHRGMFYIGPRVLITGKHFGFVCVLSVININTFFLLI